MCEFGKPQVQAQKTKMTDGADLFARMTRSRDVLFYIYELASKDVEYPTLLRGILRMVCRMWSELFAFEAHQKPKFETVLIEAAKAPGPIRNEVALLDLLTQKYQSLGFIKTFNAQRTSYVNKIFWASLVYGKNDVTDYVANYTTFNTNRLAVYIAKDRSLALYDRLAKDLTLKLLPYARNDLPLVRGMWPGTIDTLPRGAIYCVYVFTDTDDSRKLLVKALAANVDTETARYVMTLYDDKPLSSIVDWFLCDFENKFAFWFFHVHSLVEDYVRAVELTRYIDCLKLQDQDDKDETNRCICKTIVEHEDERDFWEDENDRIEYKADVDS